MKKILYIFLILMFLFASCSKTSEKNDLSNSDLTIENDCNGLPMVVYAKFTDLKEIKSAFDTMNSEEFATYMQNEKFSHYIMGTWDFENSEALIEELFSTTVPLLDGDESNFPEIRFYWERNEAQQLIFFDENSRVSVYSYTPKSGRAENSLFGANNKNAVLLKELNCNGVSVLIYKTDNEESFFADVFVDGTYIFMSTKHIETIDEIEAFFARLEFVKIGDLLERSNTETTNAESVSHTGLSDEEATTEINIATELSVESVTYDLLEAEITE